MGEEQANAPLTNVLEDKDWDVRKTAAGALDTLGWQPGQDKAGALYWMTQHQWDTAAAVGEPAVQPLVAALDETDTTIHKGVSDALAQLGAPAVDPLIAALKAIKWQMYSAVNDFNNNPITTSAMTDNDWEKRKTIISILGKIGDSRAIAPLTTMLEFIAQGDQINYHYYMTAKVVVKIQNRTITPQVKAVYIDSVTRYEKNDALRCVVAEALGQIKDPQVKNPMVNLFAQQDFFSTMLKELMSKSSASESIIATAIDESLNYDLRDALKKALQQFGVGTPIPLSFQPNTSNGDCAVCAGKVGRNEAFLVPSDIFGGSQKYHEWIENNPAMNFEVQFAGGIEAYLQAKQSNSDNGLLTVCPECVDLFKGTQEAASAEVEFTLPDVDGGYKMALVLSMAKAISDHNFKIS